MKSSEADPWPVIVRLDEVGKRLDRRMLADEMDRARIAKALGLEALNLLEADVAILQTGPGGEVRGQVHAKVVQICGVSLEPFETDIRSDFSIPFTTEPAAGADDAEDHEFGLADLDAPDVIETGVLDIGAYVIEHLALELDPFPRKPGVEFEAPPEEHEASPFAVLAELKPSGKTKA
ncbi:MAG TPA: DUF177 domain-containing protein [Caulobacteraceae bacterium]|jgi:uncharacterized metal-binding protein YceD (DUF177 family)|nr:DUF177 domain-containing protein [Caulobacteraceae bacterium]